MSTQYRASFDARVTFSNGGGLHAQGFRIDIPGPDTSIDVMAVLFVDSLGLLMSESVTLDHVEVFEEPHKGTRGGPSGAGAVRYIELSHVIRSGETTYPGLPAPEILPHMTRDASRAKYEEGTEFAIDRISMVGNTGTYMDSPFHRYDGGTDLVGFTLTQLVDLPAIVVRTAGSGVRGVGVGELAAFDVEGRAVLLNTGGDSGWATETYGVDAPYLTEAGAQWLVGNGAALVGIDSVNIDDISSGGARPAHTVLLGTGIPIVEHLTGLGDVPPLGATFTATPPMIADFGTFPVRAFAAVR